MPIFTFSKPYHFHRNFQAASSSFTFSTTLEQAFSSGARSGDFSMPRSVTTIFMAGSISACCNVLAAHCIRAAVYGYHEAGFFGRFYHSFDVTAHSRQAEESGYLLFWPAQLPPDWRSVPHLRLRSRLQPYIRGAAHTFLLFP